MGFCAVDDGVRSSVATSFPLMLFPDRAAARAMMPVATRPAETGAPPLRQHGSSRKRNRRFGVG